MIIETWKRYFVDLKLEIAVSPSLNRILLPNIPRPERRRSDIVHMRYMV
jgi:hypothetical protein